MFNFQSVTHSVNKQIYRIEDRCGFEWISAWIAYHEVWRNIGSTESNEFFVLRRSSSHVFIVVYESHAYVACRL